MNRFLLGITIVLLFSFGCEEHVQPVNDVGAPDITILAPAHSSGGEYYSHPDSNNTIQIHVEIEDNDELHEVDLYLIQDFMNGSVIRGEVMRRHYHPDNSFLTVLETWAIDTAYLSSIWVHVEANDHNLNASKDSVMIRVER